MRAAFERSLDADDIELAGRIAEVGHGVRPLLARLRGGGLGGGGVRTGQGAPAAGRRHADRDPSRYETYLRGDLSSGLAQIAEAEQLAAEWALPVPLAVREIKADLLTLHDPAAAVVVYDELAADARAQGAPHVVAFATWAGVLTRHYSSPRTSKGGPATPSSCAGPTASRSAFASSLCVLALVLVERDPNQARQLLDEAAEVAAPVRDRFTPLRDPAGPSEGRDRAGRVVGRPDRRVGDQPGVRRARPHQRRSPAAGSSSPWPPTCSSTGPPPTWPRWSASSRPASVENNRRQWLDGVARARAELGDDTLRAAGRRRRGAERRRGRRLPLRPRLTRRFQRRFSASARASPRCERAVPSAATDDRRGTADGDRRHGPGPGRGAACGDDPARSAPSAATTAASSDSTPATTAARGDRGHRRLARRRRHRPAGTGTGIDWSPCDPGFECAKVPVPLDWSDPTGEQIELAVIRYPATKPDQRIGSMFFNPGGPGDTGVGLVLDSGPDLSAWGDGRFDIVVVGSPRHARQLAGALLRRRRRGGGVLEGRGHPVHRRPVGRLPAEDGGPGAALRRGDGRAAVAHLDRRHRPRPRRTCGSSRARTRSRTSASRTAPCSARPTPTCSRSGCGR